MTTIRSTLASGIHQVTSSELAELDKLPGKGQQLPPIEVDGRQFHRTLFPLLEDKTISVLRPNTAQKLELKDTPALFTELLQHAVDVNKAYFIPEQRPPTGTIEHRRYASRTDAFNREARELAHRLYWPGGQYTRALDAIDTVGLGLATAVHGELTWGHHPTAIDRMKLALGPENFAGYDERPLTTLVGPDLSGRFEVSLLSGAHVPREKLVLIGGQSIEWGHHTGGVGSKKEE